MDSGELVDSLLGGTALNYVGDMACIRRTIARARKERKHIDMEELSRRKDLVGGQERQNLHRATRNEMWNRAITHRLMARSYLGRNYGIIFA